MVLLEEMNASEMMPREVDTDILNDLEVSNYFSISDNTVTNVRESNNFLNKLNDSQFYCSIKLFATC